MQDFESPVAQCPVHPGQPSRAACSRCGNYACDLCTERGHYTECASCRERGGRGFLFTRDAFTVSGLSKHSWACFKRDWQTLLPALMAVVIVAMVIGGIQGGTKVLIFGVKANETPFALKPLLFTSFTGLVLNLAVTPAMVGFTALCLASVRGDAMRFGLLLKPYSRFAAVAGVVLFFWLMGFPYNLTMGLFFADQSLAQAFKIMGLALLVLSPVLFYVGTGLGFAYNVLAGEPELGAIAALRRSWQIASGHRFQIFRIALLSGLALGAGALLCLLPLFVVLPWASLIWSAGYLALATPTPAHQIPVRPSFAADARILEQTRNDSSDP